MKLLISLEIISPHSEIGQAGVAASVSNMRTECQQS